MTPISSTSRNELTERRQSLRRQRRWRLLQNLWRASAISGIAVGSAWLMTRPVWLIRQPSQVTVQGNQLLSPEQIQSLLPIDYPKALLEIEPEAIEAQLETLAPIVQAKVTRRLLPPRLVVQVEERHPVAIALPKQTEISDTIDLSALDPNQTGLLDASGLWMPLSQLAELDQADELPPLRIYGFSAQQTAQQTEWSSLYQYLQTSPVQIKAIDWRIPSNLILHTELGIVHFGSYSFSYFPKQIEALNQMRQLPQQLNGQTIDYIDLRNPQAPKLQIMTKN